MCKISHGSIVLADIPFNPANPHAHFGKHYYIIVANSKACLYSPVVQAIPLSSNINRRLPVQIEISADCLSERSFALAEQLTLLPKKYLEEGRYCGSLENSQMRLLQDAIKLQLSLD